ncbi:MAG: phytanoyl-CoA dioxygenase family protein [Verrucomicrobiales bacterium]|nr:phytanoyl-CoA dioxygenase family protein [Verrucomicrobiales bacterium]
MSFIPELQFSEGFEASLLSDLRDVGVVKVFGATTPGEIEKLNAEFEEILAADQSGVRDLGVEVGGGKKLIRHELEGAVFPETIRYFTQQWMQNLSDLYWGNTRVLNDNVFVTREIPGTKHLAQDLHFDVQETLKFFLYLNDVTAENGAFSCVPRSLSLTKEKRQEIGDEVSYENREYTRDHPFSEEEIVPVEAAAGTIIVFTTEVWHRAGLVSSGERRVMRGHTRTPDKSGKIKDQKANRSIINRLKGFLSNE